MPGIDQGLTSYGDPGLRRYMRRAFLASAGYDANDLDRPVVGIADTSSDYTTCHRQMPELVRAVARGVSQAGGLPLVFRSLVTAGGRDMLRVSDARMSGTAYGTVVLHCSPEAAAGGPLAFVRNGDKIELDATEGRLDLLVDREELVRRQTALAPPPIPERGWRRLFAEHVLPAHLGADLDFLA